MLKRLRVKFVLINMTVVLVLLSIIFGMVVYFTGQQMKTRTEAMLESLLDDRGPGGPDGDGPALMDRLGRDDREEFPHRGEPDRKADSLPVPYLHIHIAPDGTIEAHGDRFFDAADTDYLTRIVAAVEQAGEKTGSLPGYNLRFAAQENDIYLLDFSSNMETMRSLITTCLMIGVLALILFGLGSFWLARWAIRPVEEAWNQQRRFVADASHELKTPLTVITTNAELLQMPDVSEEGRSRSAQSILTMSRQMRGLVEGMLELARADSGMNKMLLEELDFSELVNDASLPFEAVFFERSLELTCQIEQGINLRCSGTHLRQVVEILLDNAQKYANSNTEVQLRLSRKPSDQVLLEVSSHGPELSSEECKLIFERFYRADSARAMNCSYGLGLAIANRIVTDHRGRIWATCKGDLTTFHVQLPLK